MADPFKPPFPFVGRAAMSTLSAVLWPLGGMVGLHSARSRSSKGLASEFQHRLALGETVWLIGLNSQAHDTGACLISADRDRGTEVVTTFEEDRLRLEPQCAGFPTYSIRAVHQELRRLDVQPSGLLAAVLPFDFPGVVATGAYGAFSESSGIGVAIRDRSFRRGTAVSFSEYSTPRALRRIVPRTPAIPIVCVPHHDAHAWHSFAASPFAEQSEPTLVAVIDALGDSSSTSFYRAAANRVELESENQSIWDSLGFYYAMMTSALGGWPLGRGEGRLMGAVAYGDYRRGTNPYYQRLRKIFSLEDSCGRLKLNRGMANWPRSGFERPFGCELIDILGEPINPENHWNPDYVLDFEPNGISPDIQIRLDRIAAAQMVFEDAVEHIVVAALRRTACRRLVLTGGASLNCLAVQRLIDRCPGVELWATPTAGDAGVQIGGAFTFAVQNGAPMTNPQPTVYLSGRAPDAAAVVNAVRRHESTRGHTIGSIASSQGLASVADTLAQVVSRGSVVGLFQGRAELGLRALGNRSILADPRSRGIRDFLNQRVKHRESFRPVAPMLTLEAAQKYFVIPPELSAADYDALCYMAINLRSTRAAHDDIPGVLHADGSARIQLVREKDNPLAYAFLRALGRHIGCEVSVNTSLNVNSPIVGTVEQALDTFVRAPMLDALMIVSSDGTAHWVAHRDDMANSDKTRTPRQAAVVASGAGATASRDQPAPPPGHSGRSRVEAG